MVENSSFPSWTLAKAAFSCAVGVDSRRSHGAGHIQHSAPLAQGVVVLVYIFAGGRAAGVKPAQRPAYAACPGLGITRGLGADAIREEEAGPFVFVQDVHLLSHI